MNFKKLVVTDPINVLVYDYGLHVDDLYVVEPWNFVKGHIHFVLCSNFYNLS